MKRKLILFGAFLSVVVALYFVFHDYLTLETLVVYETQMRDYVGQFPIRAFMLGFASYTLLSIIPGTVGKSLVYGWLFGFWWALVQVNIGLTIAATFSFLLSRYVFHDVIQSRYGLYLERLNRALRREGAFVMVMLRLAHVPYTFVNYAAGATSIRTRTFWWSSQLGMLPSNAVFVLVGAQLPTLKQLNMRGMHSIFTPQLVATFVLMAVFPLFIRWVIKYVRGPGKDDCSPAT